MHQACRHGAMTKRFGSAIQNACIGLAEDCHGEGIELHQVLAVKNAGIGLRKACHLVGGKINQLRSAGRVVHKIKASAPERP